MFGFRVVGVILLLVLCVVALSAVFDEGLNSRWDACTPRATSS